jgi:hypothetical protein
MKLTGTNCSIGFIALINNVRTDIVQSVKKTKPACFSEWISGIKSVDAVTDACACFNCSLPAWWLCEEKKPDPIPNSAVKLLCANGTLSQGTGE